jgi:hypothetical protein
MDQIALPITCSLNSWIKTADLTKCLSLEQQPEVLILTFVMITILTHCTHSITVKSVLSSHPGDQKLVAV